MAHRPLIGSTLSLAALTTFGRLVGGGREVLIARDFGTSDQLEAFLVAFGTVSLLIVAVSTAVPAALVPTYFRSGSGHPGRGRELLRHVGPRLVLGLAGASLIVAVLSPVLSVLVGGGFDPETRGLLTWAIVLLSPTILLGGWAATTSATAQASERFLLAGVPPVVNPIVSVTVVALAGSATATTLAAAFLAGYTAECVAGFVVVRIACPRWGLVAPAPAPAANAVADRSVFFAQLMPVVFAFGIQTSSTVIDQAVASHLGPGTVAVLAFGTRLPTFLAAVGITAVGTVVLPQFSRLVAGGDRAELMASLRMKVLMVFPVGVGVALVLTLVGPPLLDLVFGRGEFGSEDVAAAAGVQAVAVWAVPFQLVSVLFLRLLSAQRRNRTVLKVGVVGAAANLLLDLLLGSWLGAPGIALSTTMVVALTAAAFGWLVVRGPRATDVLPS